MYFKILEHILAFYVLSSQNSPQLKLIWLNFLLEKMSSGKIIFAFDEVKAFFTQFAASQTSTFVTNTYFLKQAAAHVKDSRFLLPNNVSKVHAVPLHDVLYRSPLSCH